MNKLGKQANNDQLTVETAITRIEAIVRELQTASLGAAIDLYKESQFLTKFVKSKLREAEVMIKYLNEDTESDAKAKMSDLIEKTRLIVEGERNRKELIERACEELRKIAEEER